MNLDVAPLAGAWIETVYKISRVNRIESHPSRVRGLKHRHTSLLSSFIASHPSRVRGLKPLCQSSLLDFQKSHPSRVRGLKLVISYVDVGRGAVAPLAGAWIETSAMGEKVYQILSHPSRVRGLKLS